MLIKRFALLLLVIYSQQQEITIECEACHGGVCKNISCREGQTCNTISTEDNVMVLRECGDAKGCELFNQQTALMKETLSQLSEAQKTLIKALMSNMIRDLQLQIGNTKLPGVDTMSRMKCSNNNTTVP